MNRFKLHILTLLAIAVASCESVNKSIDTFYLDNLQYFDVAIGCDYASKSTIVTSDNQPVTFTKFGAYAVDLSNRELFMDNARIDYNKNTTQWVSANPVTEWPSDGALFYGYAPYANGNVRSSIDSDGNMVISFNNEILARDQIDLMISNPKSKSTAGSVGLTFNHCLSAIAFRFSGDGSIKVKSVGFKGVYGSGDITATASGERSWSNLVFNDDSSYRIKLSNNNLPLTGVDALTSTNGDYLMMIPTDKEVFKNMECYLPMTALYTSRSRASRLVMRMLEQVVIKMVTPSQQITILHRVYGHAPMVVTTPSTTAAAKPTAMSLRQAIAIE